MINRLLLTKNNNTRYNDVGSSLGYESMFTGAYSRNSGNTQSIECRIKSDKERTQSGAWGDRAYEKINLDFTGSLS